MTGSDRMSSTVADWLGLLPQCKNIRWSDLNLKHKPTLSRDRTSATTKTLLSAFSHKSNQ